MKCIAVIGCGKIAQTRHIPEYAANPDCELRGYYNPTASRAEEMAAKYGGKVYASVEELLADGEIDAVSVCCPNVSHAAISSAAMKAGKDVLCEKPMAVSEDECEEMLRVSRETGRRLLIAHNQRFNGAHVMAKDLIKEGLIGRPLTFRTFIGHCGPETWAIKPGKDTWFFSPDKAAMGAIADLGIHKTDLMRFLLGQDIVRVTARMMTLDKRGPNGALIGVDDNAFCIYELSGGTAGTMTASWTHYGYEDNSTVIYGSKGIMRLYDAPEHPLIVTLADGTAMHYDAGRMQTNDDQTFSGVIDEFISAISEGRPSVLDAENIENSMKAVLGAVRSAGEGITVEI